MNDERLELRALIAGELREPVGDVFEFEYGSDLTVALPKPDEGDAKLMTCADGEALRRLSIDDLTIFFAEVANRWADPTNRWRQIVSEFGPRVTGYASKTIEADMATLVETLQRHKQYDFIASDLGDPALLDEWAADRAVLRRLWPKGVVTHVMVGNVPLAALFTLYRSLVTKNVTIAKVPRRDVVTALCFAMCIHETDPTHPVTRSLSALYWEPESDVEDQLIARSDVLSIWGRDESVTGFKRRIPSGVDFVEFGPKRSFTVVLDGVSDWEDAARRVAFDVALYDQEACFSPQEAYVQGDPAHLLEPLTRWLTLAATNVPRRELTADTHAHIQRTRIEALAQGWTVHAPAGTDWTIIQTDRPVPVEETPLARTLYVHPIADIGDVIPFIDRDVQTVSVGPWDRIDEVRDTLTECGADRLVPLGRMGQFRAGFLHDGFEPMRRLVRWATIERPLDYKYRFTRPGAVEREEARISKFLAEP